MHLTAPSLSSPHRQTPCLVKVASLPFNLQVHFLMQVLSIMSRPMRVREEGRGRGQRGVAQHAELSLQLPGPSASWIRCFWGDLSAASPMERLGRTLRFSRPHTCIHTLGFFLFYFIFASASYNWEQSLGRRLKPRVVFHFLNSPTRIQRVELTPSGRFSLQSVHA